MKTGKRQVEDAVADRRSFLKLAGASAAAGGAALLPAAAVAAEGARETTSLYRETEHVRRYYELAR